MPGLLRPITQCGVCVCTGNCRVRLHIYGEPLANSSALIPYPSAKLTICLRVRSITAPLVSIAAIQRYNVICIFLLFCWPWSSPAGAHLLSGEWFHSNCAFTSGPFVAAIFPCWKTVRQNIKGFSQNGNGAENSPSCIADIVDICRHYICGSKLSSRRNQ